MIINVTLDSISCECLANFLLEDDDAIDTVSNPSCTFNAQRSTCQGCMKLSVLPESINASTISPFTSTGKHDLVSQSGIREARSSTRDSVCSAAVVADDFLSKALLAWQTL